MCLAVVAQVELGEFGASHSKYMAARATQRDPITKENKIKAGHSERSARVTCQGVLGALGALSSHSRNLFLCPYLLHGLGKAIVTVCDFISSFI